MYASDRNWNWKRSLTENVLKSDTFQLLTPGPRRLVFAASPSDPAGGGAKTSVLKLWLKVRSPLDKTGFERMIIRGEILGVPIVSAAVARL